VHSFYRSGVPSGENTVVMSQAEGLADRGHDVLLIRRDTSHELDDRTYRARAAIRVLTGFGPSPMSELTRFGPDVVHVHNLVPGFGSSWLADVPVPIVATVHNFRPICANALLFRAGHLCTECPDGSPWAAVRHGCYQDSHVASIPLAARNARGLGRDALLSRARAIICLSSTARTMLARYGLDLSKTHVIPNGVEVAASLSVNEHISPRWLAAGRLSPEKGMLELARHWPPGEPLEILGSGPEADAIRALGRVDVELKPSIFRDEFLTALPAYQGLVLPSPCIDSQPTVVSEALASGLPVLARAGNSVADLVEETGCGVVYESADALGLARNAVSSDRLRYSQVARSVYLERFTLDAWLQSLESLYSSTLGAS